MTDLALHRMYLPDMTLGRLYVGEDVYATIERPWIANVDGPGGVLRESCVPDGDYRLIPHESSRFPGTYALINEQLGVWYQQRPAGQSWGRTAILIHSGNWVRNVIGCIAIGMQHGRLGDQRAVIDSARAMREIRAALGRTDEHRLRIIAMHGTVELAA